MIRLLIALFFGYIVFRCTSVMRDVDAQRDTINSAQSSASVGVLAPPVVRAPVWQRDVFTDALTGKGGVAMRIESDNIESFQIPYDGGSAARFVIRRHPQYGLDAYIAIDKGQLTCDYQNCRVSWRVDDKPIRQIEVIKPADGSSNIFFLASPARLIKDLKGAKRLIVQTTIYQEGDRAWQFNVAGFAAP